MRKLLLFLSLCISTNSFCQTKEDFQNYIKKTIEDYTYKNDQLFYNYVIEYDDENVIINSIYEVLFLDGGPIKSKYWIPIRDLDVVHFEEQKGCTWLCFNLVNGKQNIKKIDHENNIEYMNNTQLIISKSIYVNRIDDRIVNSFFNLNKFYKNDVNSQISSPTVVATKLDEKNGFKDFKIGDDYKKWQPNLIFTNTADDNIRYYDFKGECCNSLFLHKLEKIRLGFKDDKLVVIYLVTPTDIVNAPNSSEWCSSQYRDLKANFSKAFDLNVSDVPSADNSGKVSCFWKGENISLILNYEYMGVKQISGEAKSFGRCTVMISKNKPNILDF